MLIVDTGPLVSIADTKDRHYQSCLALLQSDSGPLVTTSFVVRPAHCAAFILVPYRKISGEMLLSCHQGVPALSDDPSFPIACA